MRFLVTGGAGFIGAAVVRNLLKRGIPGASVTADELAAAVRRWLPEAQFEFDDSKPTTPLVDWQSGKRLEAEIDFKPRSLVEGVRAHINEARAEAGLEMV